MPRAAGLPRRKKYTQSQKLAYYKQKSASRYAGAGKYKITAPRSAAVGQSMGETIGSAASFIPGFGKLLAPVASNLIGKLGSYLGNKLGTYAGWGEYYVKKNTLAVPEGNSPASMHSSGMTTRVCHREYIGDVISAESAGAFKLESFPLQPGDHKVFPWLSDVALNYQKYRLLGCIVEFKSGSGDALDSVNTALGEVIISTNYNNADPDFTSRGQMENTQYCSSAKPSVSMVHIIECDPALQAQTALYVSQSSEPEVGLTPNEINWANVQVATVGCQGTSVNLGSIYITYDIELIQPIELGFIRHPVGDWFWSDNVGQLTTQAYSNAAPLGLITEANSHNSLGGSVSSEDTYSFPANIDSGLFLLDCHWVAGTAAALTYPTLVLTNCVQRTVLVNGKASILTSPQPSGPTQFRAHECICIEVTGRGATVQFTSSVLPAFLSGSAQYMSLMVNNVDGSFKDASAFLEQHAKKVVHRITSEGEELPLLVQPKSDIRREYEEALQKSNAECSDVGDSPAVYKLRQRLKELEAHGH